MASSSRKRVRFTFDMSFVSHEEDFQQRLKNVRKLLTPAGAPSLDNTSLFNALCDAVEAGSHQTSDPLGANAGPTMDLLHAQRVNA